MTAVQNAHLRRCAEPMEFGLHPLIGHIVVSVRIQCRCHNCSTDSHGFCLCSGIRWVTESAPTALKLMNSSGWWGLGCCEQWIQLEEKTYSGGTSICKVFPFVHFGSIWTLSQFSRQTIYKRSVSALQIVINNAASSPNELGMAFQFLHVQCSSSRAYLLGFPAFRISKAEVRTNRRSSRCFDPKMVVDEC